VTSKVDIAGGKERKKDGNHQCTQRMSKFGKRSFSMERFEDPSGPLPLIPPTQSPNTKQDRYSLQNHVPNGSPPKQLNLNNTISNEGYWYEHELTPKTIDGEQNIRKPMQSIPKELPNIRMLS